MYHGIDRRFKRLTGCFGLNDSSINVSDFPVVLFFFFMSRFMPAVKLGGRRQKWGKENSSGRICRLGDWQQEGSKPEHEQRKTPASDLEEGKHSNLSYGVNSVGIVSPGSHDLCRGSPSYADLPVPLLASVIQLCLVCVPISQDKSKSSIQGGAPDTLFLGLISFTAFHAMLFFKSPEGLTA